MINKTIPLLLVIAALCLAGCGKTSDNPDDIASQISGTYYGDYNYSGGSVVDATVSLSRYNDSTVNLSARVAGSLLYNYHVRVSPDPYGKITLFYDGWTNDLYGVVDGNELSYTHGYNYFTGIKP